MKIDWSKNVMPHLIAVIIFVVVSVIYCKPVLDGNVLSQHDITGWKGSVQNAFDVKEKTGRMPLWNTHVFSGMPNYQIAMEGKSIIPVDLNRVMALWLPKPINYFFLAAISFYILCLVLGMRPVIGILGGLAYAFSTYNPIIIIVGHETKMMAIAYMPLLLAGVLLIFNKRYWIGLAVATIGATLELMANHPQVNYYFFIVAAALTIAYLVIWIKNRDFKHIALSFVLTAIAALVGLGNYSLAYLTTSEYAKYTMRGGKNVEIKGNEVKAVKTKGLDAEYAFQYSMSTTEPLVMLMPKAFGGSSLNVSDENSNIVKKLSQAGVPEPSAAQLAQQLPVYWGGMSGPGEGTSGPPYIGAIIFILAIIGFVIVKGPVKWALLAATLISVFMSWGKYFEGFNTFLFETLPLYNKFRAPSMALIIAEFTMPLMAVIAVNFIFFAKDAKENLRTNFKKILYTLGGLTALLALLYIGQSYGAPLDKQILEAKFDQSGTDTINRAVIAGLKADRQSLFGAGLLRSVVFMALLLGLLYAYLKNIIKPVIAVTVLAFITFIDLWVVDKQYLNNDSFVAKDELQTESFAKTPVDEKILQDTDPHFRVLDFSRGGMNDNRPSYYHRSVLGYHPAKLRIYQDIIDRYFSLQPNEQILNALDTKYIVTVNQQGQQQIVQNPNVYGAAWFVKAIKTVASDVDELQTIGSVNLNDTAIVQQSYMQNMGTIVTDTAATITLVKYTNDEMEYAANTTTPQFAVFSEVYYPAGWNAYVDGQKIEIIKTDYFLRGLKLPAGKHSVKMLFEPETVKKGMNISYISSFLFVILVIGGFFMQWWVDKKN